LNFFSISPTIPLSAPPIELGPSVAHQAVFLPVVQPVTCTACPNDALQLICLHPDNFIYPFITPEVQTFSAQLHGPKKKRVKQLLSCPYFLSLQDTEMFSVDIQ